MDAEQYCRKSLSLDGRIVGLHGVSWKKAREDREMLRRRAEKNTGKLRNCPICGRLYADLGRGLCPGCYSQQEGIKEEAVRYANEHPEATMEEISKATGVHSLMIHKMELEGKFGNASKRLEYACSRCGRPITAGKLCQACMESFHRDVDKVQRKYDKAHPKEAAVRRKKEMEENNRLARKALANMEVRLEQEQKLEREQERVKQEQADEMLRKAMEARKALLARRKIRRMFYLESKEREE